MSSNSSIEPKTEAKVTESRKKSRNDMAIDNGIQVRDVEVLPDFKEAEVLDAYGNEDGAEVKCKIFGAQLALKYG